MNSIKSYYASHRRLFVLLGGTLLYISIGSFYTYNTVGVYIVTYLQRCSGSKSTSSNDLVWIFFAAVFGMGSSVSFGDYISDHIGPFLTVLISGLFLSATVILMVVTLRTYFIVVLLTSGLLNGIAAGVVYGVVMGSVCSWFPVRKGTVMGVLVAGFAFSSFIFGLIQYKFIFRNKDWLNNIPISYVLLGSILVVLQIIGSLLIQKKPIENADQTEELEGSHISLDEIQVQEPPIEMKPNNLIFEVDFWIMWITYSLMSASLILIITFDKEFGHGHIQDNSRMKLIEAVTLLGFLSNSISGVFWGMVIDRFRYKIVMLILTLGFGFFSLSFYYTKNWFTEPIPGSNNMSSIVTSTSGAAAVYFIWTIFLYFFSYGIYVIFPITSWKMFGNRYFVINYGMLLTAWSGGALLAGSISHFIWINKKHHSDMYFCWTFTIAAIMALASAGLTVLYSGKVRHASRYRGII